MEGHADRNGGPWIVEDIAKGPCMYAFQFRCLVWCRRLGLKRMSRVESETGSFKNRGNESFVWCRSVTQGLREYQEDRNIVAEPVVVRSARSRGKEDEYFLFSVFDGHGRPSHGHKISDFCEKNFAVYLSKEVENVSALSLSNREGHGVGNGSSGLLSQQRGSIRQEKLGSINSLTGERRDPEEPFFMTAFERTCKTIDNAVRRRFPTVSLQNGCTATALMLGCSKAVFANLGDSRGAQFVASNDDNPGRVVFATHDHKPSRFDEANRIAKAGGWVEANRVNGDLAVSRTIGDLEYKPHGSPVRLCPISIKPSVDVVKRVKGSGLKELYIIASDGLWDGISTAHACQYIVDHVKKAKEQKKQKGVYCQTTALKSAVESLIRFVFKRRLSADNITVVVVMPAEEEDETDLRAEEEPPKNPSTQASSTSTPQVEPEQSPSTGIPSEETIHKDESGEVKENSPLDGRDLEGASSEVRNAEAATAEVVSA